MVHEQSEFQSELTPDDGCEEEVNVEEEEKGCLHDVASWKETASMRDEEEEEEDQ